MRHIDLIAARMEQARWRRGISVAELARRVGVDRKRLWRVLNGERAMRADELVRLCAELGIGLGAFIVNEAPARPAEAMLGGGTAWTAPDGSGGMIAFRDGFRASGGNRDIAACRDVAIRP